MYNKSLLVLQMPYYKSQKNKKVIAFFWTINFNGKKVIIEPMKIDI